MLVAAAIFHQRPEDPSQEVIERFGNSLNPFQNTTAFIDSGTYEKILLEQYPWAVGFFRLYADELADLANALKIPDPFYTQSHHKFMCVKGLALLLARFRSPGNIYVT